MTQFTILTDYTRFDSRDVSDLAGEVRAMVQGEGDDIHLVDATVDVEFVSFLRAMSEGHLGQNFEMDLLRMVRRNPNMLFERIGLPLRIFLGLKYGIKTLTSGEYSEVKAILGEDPFVIPLDEYRGESPPGSIKLDQRDMNFESSLPETGTQTPKIIEQPEFHTPPHQITARLNPKEAIEQMKKVQVPLASAELTAIFRALNDPMNEEFINEVYEKVKYKGFDPSYFVNHCINVLKMSPRTFKIYAYIGAFTNNPLKVDKTALDELGIDYPITSFVKNKQEMHQKKQDIQTALMLSRFSSCIPGFVVFSLAQTKDWHGVYPDDSCPAWLQFFGAMGLKLNAKYRKAHNAWAMRHSVSISRESKQEFNQQLYDTVAARPFPRDMLPDMVLEFLKGVCTYDEDLPES